MLLTVQYMAVISMLKAGCYNIISTIISRYIVITWYNEHRTWLHHIEHLLECTDYSASVSQMIGRLVEDISEQKYDCTTGQMTILLDVRHELSREVQYICLVTTIGLRASDMDVRCLIYDVLVH